MAFASVWAAAQLMLLGSPTRSLRLPALLTLVGVGMYAVPAVTIPLQFLVTRGMALLPWWDVRTAVEVAAYTVDPFIEEVLKVAPLLVFGLGSWRWARTSRQWGVTDWVIAGGAVGAGFGLLEAMMRLAHRADAAVAVPGGWLMPVGFAPPVIPGPAAAATSWLPKPFTAELFGFSAEVAINEHVAWSAVAGLAVGLLLRYRSSVRWVALSLVVWASGDHAASNWDILADDSTLGTIVSAPFRLVHPLLGLAALVALAVGVWLDGREMQRRRAEHPELLLAGEQPSLVSGAATIARHAVVGAPWSAWVSWRFALARRAALRSDDTALRTDLVQARTMLDRANSSAAWKGVGLRAPGSASMAPPPPAWAGEERQLPREGPGPQAGQSAAPARRQRSWRKVGALAVWTFLGAASLWLLGVGTTPGLVGLLDPLDSTLAARLALVPLVVAVGWTAWQWRRGLPITPPAATSSDAVASRHGVLDAHVVSADRVIRVVGQLAITASAAVLSMPVILQGILGADATDRLLRNFHLLDALGDMLFVVGIALLIAGFFLFPPAALLTTSIGTIVLVPTVTTGFVVTTSLGLTSILLSQAASNGGGQGGSGQGGQSSGGSGGGIPQRPPRPKPPVRHWKLRNIVDGLWRHHARPDRIGNGTSMDAFRNEVLTGRATQGSMHRQKLQDAANGLRNWIRNNPASDGTTLRSDRQTARQLLAEIESLLRSGAP